MTSDNFIAPAINIDAPTWLDAYSREAGREITLAKTMLHQTTYWAIGATAAVVTAIVLAAEHEFDEWRVAFIGISFLLTLRFFFRSCADYIHMIRWSRIYADITRVYLAPVADRQGRIDNLTETIQKLHIEWKTPLTRVRIIWENLKLGYGYLFLINVAILIYGYMHQKKEHGSHDLCFLFVIGIFSLIECIGFAYKRRAFWQQEIKPV